MRQAWREALVGAEVEVGEEDGRYENLVFEAESPEAAMRKVRVVLDSPEVGRAARFSCIVTCEGKQGWNDYLLLHHFDRMLLDRAAAGADE